MAADTVRSKMPHQCFQIAQLFEKVEADALCGIRGICGKIKVDGICRKNECGCLSIVVLVVQRCLCCLINYELR
jgi:hypothetical protein